jgi:signal transduction histidine kinase
VASGHLVSTGVAVSPVAGATPVASVRCVPACNLLSVDIAGLWVAAREVLVGRGRPVRPRPRPGRLARLGRLSLLVLTLVVSAATWANGQWAGLPVQLVGLLGTAPLALVDRWPLVAWRLTAVGGLLALLAPAEGVTMWVWQPGPIFVYLVVLVAVATTQELRVIIGVWLSSMLLVVLGADSGSVPSIIVFVSLLIGAGDQLRQRRSVQRDLAEQEERSAVLVGRESVLAERARTDRELPGVDIAGLWVAAREVLVGRGRPVLSPPRPRRLARLGRLSLLVLALVVAAATWAGGQRAGLPVQVVGLLGTAPLALIDRWPLVAWRITAVGGLLRFFVSVEGATTWAWQSGWAEITVIQPGTFFVYLVVLVAVATTQESGVVIGVWLVSCVVVPGGAFFFSLLMAAGYQLRPRLSAVERELAEQEERSAVLAGREAVLAERARIARELHDVVAHHMSMIAVRTESAPYRLGAVDGPTQAEFDQISATAREALVEMRRLLGVLRSDQDEPPTAPQPGLAELPGLVADRRLAGEVVQLDLSEDLDGLIPSVELTVYRIVQEALSNAARHAPGAPVQVVLERDRRELSVTVRNAKPAHPSLPSGSGSGPGHGHGLVGMRERVSMLDGQLYADTALDGGFEVHVVLPLIGECGEGAAAEGTAAEGTGEHG